MSEGGRVRVVFGVVSALLAVAGPFLIIPAKAQPVDTSAAVSQSTPASVERIAELIRLWTFVRLFHVNEGAMWSEWEAAFAEAAEPALHASDDAVLGRIAARMMSRMQSEGFGRSQTASPRSAESPPDPQVRIVGGRAIASCPAIATAVLQRKGGNAFNPEVKAAIRDRGLIFDCRRFASGPQGEQQRYIFGQWFAVTAPEFIAQPVARGAIRSRFHDGYPPDAGRLISGYSRGALETQFSRLEAKGSKEASPKRIVFMVDATTPEPWALAGGMQAAGLAKVVAQGSIAEPGVHLFKSEHLTAPVRVGEYIAPTGVRGFRPDSCVSATADGAAMAAARALLSGAKGPRCLAPSTGSGSTVEEVASPSRGMNSAADTDPLPLGQRMLALAKVWGTIEYFFPYRSLTDRPWSETLEEFIPVFAAAQTRQAYEDAVMRLATRMDDSHAFVRGTRAHRLGDPFAPPIFLRPVEGGFAIAGVHDPELAPRLRIGDEILAVGGMAVPQIATALRPYIAASTEQWMAQRIARLLAAGSENSDARLTIRRGGGDPFEVSIKRSMKASAAASPPQSDKPAFWRVGEGDIGYVNLERLTAAEADQTIDALMDTRAIIFDLRGYPQGTAWTLAPRLALGGREGATAAQFRRPHYKGPSLPQQSWTSFSQQIPTGDKPRYRGRIIVLINDRAISQSEHTALFFKAATNPVFVGTPTAGANGDVTWIQLPGGVSVSFTGHDVRHADGRQLQRVGIQPDVVVEPTFAGMLSGRDEILEAGIAQARME